MKRCVWAALTGTSVCYGCNIERGNVTPTCEVSLEHTTAS